MPKYRPTHIGNFDAMCHLDSDSHKENWLRALERGYTHLALGRKLLVMSKLVSKLASKTVVQEQEVTGP